MIKANGDNANILLEIDPTFAFTISAAPNLSLQVLVGLGVLPRLIDWAQEADGVVMRGNSVDMDLG